MKSFLTVLCCLFCLLSFSICAHALEEPHPLALNENTMEIEIVMFSDELTYNGDLQSLNGLALRVDGSTVSTWYEGDTSQAGGYLWSGYSATDAGTYYVSVEGAGGTRVSCPNPWVMRKQALSLEGIESAFSVQHVHGRAPRHGDSMGDLSLSLSGALSTYLDISICPGDADRVLTVDGHFPQGQEYYSTSMMARVTLLDGYRTNYSISGGADDHQAELSLPIRLERAVLTEVDWPGETSFALDYGVGLPSSYARSSQSIPGASFAWSSGNPALTVAQSPVECILVLQDLPNAYRLEDGLDAQRPYSVTVLPIEMSVQDFGLPSSAVYTGQAFTPTPRVTSNFGQALYAFNVQRVGAGDAGLTDAGQYVLEFIATDDNYTWSGGISPTYTFNIEPLAVVVRPLSGQGKLWGQADPVLAYSIEGIAPGTQPDLMLFGTLSRAAGEEPAVYEIAQGSLESQNPSIQLGFAHGEGLRISALDLSGVQAIPEGERAADGSFVESAVIRTPQGYMIASSPDGPWADTLPALGIGHHDISYYLRATDGEHREGIGGPLLLSLQVTALSLPQASPPATAVPTMTPNPAPTSIPTVTPAPTQNAATGSTTSSAPRPLLSDTALTGALRRMLGYVPHDTGLWSTAGNDAGKSEAVLGAWDNLALLAMLQAQGGVMEVIQFDPASGAGIGLWGRYLVRFSLSGGISLVDAVDLGELMPGGKAYIALASDDGSAILIADWDTQANRAAQPLLLYLPDLSEARSVAGSHGTDRFELSADGLALCFTSGDQVILMNAQSGEQIPVPLSDVLALQYDAQGRLLLGLDRAGNGLWANPSGEVREAPVQGLLSLSQRGLSPWILGEGKTEGLQTQTLHAKLILDFQQPAVVVRQSGYADRAL